MTAIVKPLKRGLSATQIKLKILQQAGLAFGAGLFVLLLALTYGLDLSPGFFLTALHILEAEVCQPMADSGKGLMGTNSPLPFILMVGANHVSSTTA